ACMSFSADQGAIWEEVDRKRAKMGTESATGAVNDIYNSYADRLVNYRDAFHAVEGQVGMAVFIGGKFACLDTFDSQGSLGQLFEKMIESYALDALEQPGNKKKIVAGSVQSLLEKIASAETKAYPSAGLGEDLRLSGDGLVGSCLVLDGRIIHLAMFEKTGDGQRRRTSLSSPSRRRRSNSSN
ncbi:MAG: ARPP-1 family domain-containing protein, partial [Bacillota bacterium]